MPRILSSISITRTFGSVKVWGGDDELWHVVFLREPVFHRVNSLQSTERRRFALKLSTTCTIRERDTGQSSRIVAGLSFLFVTFIFYS
jgi:hypothetical protein